MQLDFNLCKSLSTMVAKVARFSAVVSAIGIISLIPSFIVLAITALFLIATVVATANVMPAARSEPEQAGAAIGFVNGFWLQCLYWLCVHSLVDYLDASFY